MRFQYYRFGRALVRLAVDSEDIPEYGEFFDASTDSFVERPGLEPDVCSSSESLLISEEEFHERLSAMRQDGKQRAERTSAAGGSAGRAKFRVRALEA